MKISPNVHEVRLIVHQIMEDLGVARTDIQNNLSETVRIEDGRCLARSYRVDQYLAMWLIDVGILQFYDEQGNMVRRANLFAEIESRGMAA